MALTGVFTWGVSEVDQNTEERLLEVQTRQAATVLSTAILAIESPLRSALSVQAIAETSGARAFERSMRTSVGADKAFVSASLWRTSGDGFDQLTSL